QIEAMQIESELLYFRKNHGIAGVWTHMLLSTVADAILWLKHLLKGKSLPSLAVHTKHAALVWSLFRRTAWATRPTR
ncbi:MAG: hypothetical protein Q8R21_05930, partial [Burkholderiales bacterium]|nr:hypothetical protein [Burkholderiales bacterium]